MYVCVYVCVFPYKLSHDDSLQCSDLNLGVIRPYADWLCESGVHSVFGEWQSGVCFLLLCHVHPLSLYLHPDKLTIFSVWIEICLKDKLTINWEHK